MFLFSQFPFLPMFFFFFVCVMISKTTFSHNENHIHYSLEASQFAQKKSRTK